MPTKLAVKLSFNVWFEGIIELPDNKTWDDIKSKRAQYAIGKYWSHDDLSDCVGVYACFKDGTDAHIALSDTLDAPNNAPREWEQRSLTIHPVLEDGRPEEDIRLAHESDKPYIADDIPEEPGNGISSTTAGIIEMRDR